MLSTAFVATYYVSVMTHTIWYFIGSFQAELPWATCRPEWGSRCFNSSTTGQSYPNGSQSSADFYFK